MRKLWIGILFVGLCACAQPPATSTNTPAFNAPPAREALQSKTRAPLAASSVSFYIQGGNLPQYELIKRLPVSGIGGCTNADETTKLLIEAKKQAAALGANGVLLQLHGTMSSGMTIVKGNSNVFSVAQYAGTASGGSTPIGAGSAFASGQIGSGSSTTACPYYSAAAIYVESDGASP